MKNFLPAIAFLGLAASGMFEMSAAPDVSMMGPGTTYAEPGAEYEFWTQLTNKGDEAITSVSYTQSIEGYEDKDFTIDLISPIDVGGKKYVPFKAVAPEELYETFTMKFKITAVNGASVSKTPVIGKVTVSPFVPKHRPAVEEYTGTWCPFCPQGYVAMEAMKRDFPGMILGIVYHGGDPMDVSTFVEPQIANYAPTMRVNRSSDDPDDAGSASGSATAAIRSINTLAAAAVTMEKAEWVDDKHTNAYGKATVEFANQISDDEFHVEFVLIEDGLKGLSANWKQQNAFSGKNPAWNDDLWELFTKGSNPVSGLEFNDVCIANTLKSGSGFEASIPTTEGRTKLTFEYTFKDVNAIKEYGAKGSILQNPDKCHIAVIISDRVSKAMINCDWMHVAEASGIEDVVSDSSVGRVADKEYYTISGVKVNPENLTPGLYIIKEGNQSSKVVIR